MSEHTELDPRLTQIRQADGNDEVSLVPPPRAVPVHPPSTSESGSEPRSPVTRHGGNRWTWGRAAAAVVLGCALLAVFTLLPAWVESRRARESVGRPTHDPEARSADRETAPDATSGPGEALRSHLENAHATADELRSDLDSRGASSWAAAEFAAAVQLIAAGEASLRTGDASAAVTAFDEARQRLEELEDRSPRVARQALDDGTRALEAGDSRAATAAFQLALRIEPGNRTAMAGLQRAGRLDEVLTLLDEARSAERGHDLERAADRYRRAAALDPLSQDARSGLERVTRSIERDEFASQMSAGLDALEREDFTAASDSFEQAARMRPQSPEAADGLARTETAQRTRAIEDHLTRGADAERSERWRAAAAEYDQVLAIDPTVAAALHGRDRAVTREQLAARIEFHLDHPDRLSTDRVLEEASELLEHARIVSPQGPVLARQIERLDGLIRVASTPIRVEVESDGLTEIVIHRVGRLGTFTHRSLELRPGIYTVVGTRRGFRDVRLEWRVGPGMGSEPLVVRCEEEI